MIEFRVSHYSLNFTPLAWYWVHLLLFIKTLLRHLVLFKATAH